jgi:TonB family protein
MLIFSQRVVMLKFFFFVTFLCVGVLLGFSQEINRAYLDSDLNPTKRRKAQLIRLVTLNPDQTYQVELIHKKTKNALSVKNYKDDSLQIQHGPFVLYGSTYFLSKNDHKEPFIKETGFYKDGLKDSIWIKYGYDRKKASASHFKNDTLNGVYKKWENERLIISGFYQNGNKNGLWQTYNYQGKLLNRGHYVDGVKDGKWEVNFGEIRTEGLYRNGKREGVWKAYYANGQLRREWSYKEHTIHGEFKAWYANGVLSDSGRYENGQKVGEWLHYFESGQKSCYEFYEVGGEQKRRYWKEDGEFLHPFVVEILDPSFKGGSEALMNYINRSVHYPLEAIENGIQGTVYVQFIVGWDGEILSPKIIRSPDILLSEEALRVVKEMPLWNPGRHHTIPTRVSYTIPIKFQLL